MDNSNTHPLDHDPPHDPAGDHHHEHDHDEFHDHERIGVGGYLLQLIVAVVVVGVLIAYSCLYLVSVGFSGVVTRFGEPVRVETAPGPYFKLPWPIEQAHPVDTRKRVFSTKETESLTKDQANVILNSFVMWRVSDPKTFLQSIGSPEEAERKLEPIVQSAKNEEIGEFPFSAFVSTRPADIQIGRLEDRVLEKVRAGAKEFGIEVLQVGIKRVAYPETVMDAVLSNIKADREAAAQRNRSEGERKARQIEDDARLTAAQLVAEAEIEAGRLRGEGDQKAAEIYAEAENLNPEFYRFWRSLQMIEKSLNERTTLVLGSATGPFAPLFLQPTPPAGSEPTPHGDSAGDKPQETEATTRPASTRGEGRP